MVAKTYVGLYSNSFIYEKKAATNIALEKAKMVTKYIKINLILQVAVWIAKVSNNYKRLAFKPRRMHL